MLRDSRSWRKLSSAPCPSGAEGEEDPETPDVHLASGGVVAGYTVPRQPGKSTLSLLYPILPSLGGWKLGRVIAEIVRDLAEWVAPGRPLPSHCMGFLGGRGFKFSGDSLVQPRTSEGEKEGEAPCLDVLARGEVYVCF